MRKSKQQRINEGNALITAINQDPILASEQGWLLRFLGDLVSKFSRGKGGTSRQRSLFDEKIGGTFHAAVGAGYPESGNTNESGLHWDMVCDLRAHNGHGGGTITVDGEVISTNGKFEFEGWPGLE